MKRIKEREEKAESIKEREKAKHREKENRRERDRKAGIERLFKPKDKLKGKLREAKKEDKEANKQRKVMDIMIKGMTGVTMHINIMMMVIMDIHKIILIMPLKDNIIMRNHQEKDHHQKVKPLNSPNKKENRKQVNKPNTLTKNHSEQLLEQPEVEEELAEVAIKEPQQDNNNIHLTTKNFTLTLQSNTNLKELIQMRTLQLLEEEEVEVEALPANHSMLKKDMQQQLNNSQEEAEEADNLDVEEENFITEIYFILLNLSSVQIPLLLLREASLGLMAFLQKRYVLSNFVSGF